MLNQIDDSRLHAISWKSRAVDHLAQERETEERGRDPRAERRSLILVDGARAQLAPEREQTEPDERRVDQRMERNTVARPGRAISSGVGQIAKAAIDHLDPIEELMDRLVHERLGTERDAGRGGVQPRQEAVASA